MKARLLLIILGTLIIGFFLGMLTSAQIRYQKLKPVRTFFSEEMFRRSIYVAIHPDETQQAKINEIISKYAVMNIEIQNGFKEEFDTMMKEFWSEIEPNLTKEQSARLKEMEEQRVEMFNRDPDRRPPSDSNDFRNNRNTPPRFDDSAHFRTPDAGFNSNQRWPGFDSLNFRSRRDSTVRPIQPIN